MGMEGNGINLELSLFRGSKKVMIPGLFRIILFSHTFFWMYGKRDNTG
jgi:hypothetical protein